MNRLYAVKAFLRSVLLVGLAALTSRFDAAAASADAEASPLFARSMQNAVLNMVVHDLGSQRSDPGPSEVIIVAETQWYNRSFTRWDSARPLLKLTRQDGPTPSQVTTDISCMSPTMFCPNCLPTRTGAPTCVMTCVDPGPTCLVHTCAGGPTCEATPPTCVGATCIPAPTCVISTCTGTPTCTSTCVPAECRTALYNVTVPQAGQIQLSFDSSSQLQYVLQYCTNLSAGEWTEAWRTNGNGGMLTLRHTNGASVSVYRLLITNP